MGWTIVLFALSVQLVFSSVSAATFSELEVTREQNAYRIDFDIVLNADVMRVRELLGDHTQWPRLSRKVREGHRLETFVDGRERVRVSFRPCIVIFCTTVNQVKDVTRLASGEILTDIVPAGGDFAAGWECWRILPERHGTRVQYQAVLVPNHRVLPLIGRWILANSLRQTLTEAANKLEMLATVSTGRIALQVE